MNKLSPTQKNVITLMRQNWELGCSHAYGERTWLQFGGIGKGGKSKDIRSSTLKSLKAMNLIVLDRKESGFSIYALSDTGKQLIVK